MRAAVRDNVLSPDGIPIAYEVHGAGMPALVFIHGWSCDRSYWDAQVDPFAQTHQVVAIDLGGHGESGLARKKWTIESFGADAVAVVDKLGLGRMVLVGHSMGGDVILEAARLLPGRIQGLVWVDVYKKLDHPRAHEAIQKMVASFRADFAPNARAFVRGMFPSNADPSLVERVVSDISAAPPIVALAAAESAWNYRPEPILKELGLPLVAINPDHPPTDVESMRRYGIEVVLASGVGHFPMMENPEGFNELLAQVIRLFGVEEESTLGRDPSI
jgi:pimeloyl-ACP methyl ester carboxylesterase